MFHGGLHIGSMGEPGTTDMSIGSMSGQSNFQTTPTPTRERRNIRVRNSGRKVPLWSAMGSSGGGNSKDLKDRKSNAHTRSSSLTSSPTSGMQR